MQYSIEYHAENTYEFPIHEAYWQFLIEPLEGPGQRLLEMNFTSSADAPWEHSRNAFDFKVIRVRCRTPLKKISFHAIFHLEKESGNPYSFDLAHIRPLPENPEEKLAFRVEFNRFLQSTALSLIPEKSPVFEFNPSENVFTNLLGLNTWIHETIQYREGVTDIETRLEDILVQREGVCQDFAHLFLGIARQNGVPARYISGYLHQGHGYFGDTQMHAWTEAYLPGIGWLGFDPTNNLLTAADHIKVVHGRDYRDCAPLKGVLYAQGRNTTTHKVQVASQQ
ncbi:transglutaminase-like domain-containing protein [Robiginitalea sp.]|uniref:transglutaminase-like domain-containing protein n=1 Tax=Robiginitalea sp. TaxID=1902411 RepID=UPI003C383668